MQAFLIAPLWRGLIGGDWDHGFFFSMYLPGVGKKAGQQADGGKVGADFVDEDDAGHVGESAEYCGADAAHAEGESEEESGDHSYSSGDEILRVDEDGREGRCDNEADDDAEYACPEEICVGQQQGERKDSKN